MRKARQKPLGRLRVLVACGSLAILPAAFGSGTVTNCTQSDLEAAVSGGGTVLFACSGTITLTNTLVIAQDTLLDANSNTVTISGGNAVRLFEVSTNVNFRVNGLTLANGSFVGANGVNGDPPGRGQDGFGAGILNQAGSVTLVGCSLIAHYVQGGTAGVDVTNPAGTLAGGGNAFGAAVCNVGGTLNVTNCVIAGNSAQGGIASFPVPAVPPFGDAGQAWGGAVYSQQGRINFDNTSLSNNTVNGGTPIVLNGSRAGRGGNAIGGAIFASNSAVVVDGSVIVSNGATGGGLQTSVIAVGPGSGDGVGGALFLSQGSTATVRLSSFVGDYVAGGSGARFQPGGAGQGGSIFNAGRLQVLATTFSMCASSGGSLGNQPGPGQGGAICSAGDLSIDGSTFVSNLAIGGSANNIGLSSGGTDAPGEGGGIWSSGSLEITNTTITANGTVGGAFHGPFGFGQAGSGTGGGLCFKGGTGVLVNLSVAANSAGGTNALGGSPGPSQGGELGITNAAVTIRNCIIANSRLGGEVWGTIIDGGYNICSDDSANLTAKGSLNSTDPLLEALSDNGGPTTTMGLLVGSPARDAIPSDFPPTDQRGVSRPQGPAGDIGAFEAEFISAAPSIVTQPQGVMARAGTNVTFIVGASGTEPLLYQWNKDGNTNPIIGATASSLVLSNVQAADQGTYSVLVTNIYGSAVSAGAVLVVDSTPLILTEPTSVIVSAGATTSFSVTADGPGLSYQWYHNSNTVTGGTGATLTIGSALAGAQGNYFVIVSNFAGMATSTVATLSFDASALSILVQPKDTSAEVGYPASFSVLVSGISPIAYQWQHNGTNLAGQVGSTLALPSVSAGDAGTYDVIVTNGYRSVTSATANLTVTPGAVPPQLVLGRSANTLTITFNAEAGRQYRLLLSTDFATWSAVSTNSAILSGPLQFTESTTAAPRAFYRVVTP